MQLNSLKNFGIFSLLEGFSISFSKIRVRLNCRLVFFLPKRSRHLHRRHPKCWRLLGWITLMQHTDTQWLQHSFKLCDDGTELTWRFHDCDYTLTWLSWSKVGQHVDYPEPLLQHQGELILCYFELKAGCTCTSNTLFVMVINWKKNISTLSIEALSFLQHLSYIVLALHTY